MLDEIEAGEWENCWHVAGVLFETPLDSWSEYRQRALKFYNASDIEHRRDGPRPWGATQPPHLSAQSDLYWAVRVGFSDANLEKAGETSVLRARIVDSLEELRTIQSSTALHVLRSERTIEKLAEDVQNRLMPSDEYWLGVLRERLPTLLENLPFPTIEHLMGALKRKFAKEWDDCSLCLCKSVESLFHEVFAPRIQECQDSKELKLLVPQVAKLAAKIFAGELEQNSALGAGQKLSRRRPNWATTLPSGWSYHKHFPTLIWTPWRVSMLTWQPLRSSGAVRHMIQQLRMTNEPRAPRSSGNSWWAAEAGDS